MAQLLAWYQHENQFLRSRLPPRLTISRQERRSFLKYGRRLGSDIRQVVSVVHPQTFLRWLREEQKSGPKPQPVLRGRRRTELSIHRLVCKLARENNWGYGRIVGELRKLGIKKISASTVKNILQRNGLEPSPKRRGDTWDDFIKRHAQTLWQCDFFSQKAFTWRGIRRLYVLAFLHVETRRVYLSEATFYPKQDWVSAQTKEFIELARDDGLRIGEMVHDRDTKFSQEFRQALRSKRIRSIRIPYRAPMMNAYVERFIGTLRQECLQHFVVLGERHLNYLLAEFRTYYLKHRPHQGRQNLPLQMTPLQRHRWKIRPRDADPELTVGAIHCESRLGGLIKHYYRNAA